MTFRRALTMGAVLWAACVVLPVRAAEECDYFVCFGIDWSTATLKDIEGINVNARVPNEKKKDELSMGSNAGKTPLHYAAGATQNPAVVKALLKAGAKVNARDKSGDTPLHQAAINKNAEVVKVLLEAGADVHAKSVAELTPLHRAARNKNSAVAQFLLQAGAKVNARTDTGRTPLHSAAETNTAEVVKVLLAAGAEVNALVGGDLAPLHSAALLNPNPEVVIVLLEAGADPKIKFYGTSTAFDLAEKNPALKDTEAYWALNEALYK